MKITEKEQKFLVRFLEENDCNAETANDLLADNYSCKIVDELMEEQELNFNKVGGLISALDKKSILVIEERERDADLYWANSNFLKAVKKSGQGDTVFGKIDFSLVEF